MANIILSINMNLPVPIVGVDPGPQYATDVNSCLTLIDSHNHTPGRGLPITPDAIDINIPLTMNGNFLTDVGGVTLNPQTTPPAVGTVYENGVDLFFIDGDGNNVRLTQGGSVAGAAGSISGLVPPTSASASYVAIDSTFVWQSNINVAANMDAGSYIFRDLTVSSPGVTVSAPTALASDYSLVLPTLPASIPQPLIIDTAGNITPGLIDDTMITPATITYDKLEGTVVQRLTQPGSIIMYGGTSAPVGYVLCDGTSYLRSAFPPLFTAIGTAYGTADSLHFNVPDLRGMFPRGVSGASGNDPDASSRVALNSGGNTGNNVGSQQGFSNEAHHHRIELGTGSNGSTANVAGTIQSTTGTSTLTDSSGGSAEARPINVYVNFIIKIS